MDIYLEHLVVAFNNVDEKYFSSWAFNDYPVDAEEEDRKKYVQFIERVFAYELYHQFRKIMEANSSLYEDLVLNGEVRKNGFEESIICKNHIYPDLVLHKNQTNVKADYQKLFIEIKSHSITDKQLKDDLEKLVVAVSERLNFNNGVFICIYTHPNLIFDKLNSFLKKLKIDNTQLSKIWFLSKGGLKQFNS